MGNAAYGHSGNPSGLAFVAPIAVVPIFAAAKVLVGICALKAEELLTEGLRKGLAN